MPQQNPLALIQIEGTTGPVTLQSLTLPNVLELITGDSRNRAIAAAQAVKLDDTLAILDFGFGAQEKIGAISTKMLEGVRINDMGGTPVTAEIDKLNAAWKQIDPHPVIKASGKFMGGLSGKIKAWVKGYQEVNAAIAAVEAQINAYKVKARADIKELDQLYIEADQLAAYAKEMEASCLYLLVRLAKKYETDKKALNTADENAVYNLQALGDVISQIDQRRFASFATRGQVVLTKSKIRMIQQMDTSLYGALTTKLLLSIPQMKTDLALMAKLLQSEKSATFLKELSEMEEKRGAQIDARLAADAKTVATLTNDASKTMVRIIAAYDNQTKLLDEVEQIKANGNAARREGEQMIAQVQANFQQKVGDFKAGDNLNLPADALQAAKTA